MKPRTHCALSFALSLAFVQPANAFDKFIRLFTASYLLYSECDGQFEIDNAQFKREADKAGFDWRRFVPPVHAAMMAGADGKYDETKLIPEVTRMVRTVEKQIEDEMSRDKVRTCKGWGEIVTSAGLMRRLKWAISDGYYEMNSGGQHGS